MMMMRSFFLSSLCSQVVAMMFKCICVCVQTTHFYWGMREIFEFFLLNLAEKRAVKQQKNKIINKKCHH